MKCLNECNTDDDGNHHHNNNWLGFSLSPHMNMDQVTSSTPHHHHDGHDDDDHHHYYHQPHHPSSAAAAASAVSYLSHSQLNDAYGVSMMPVKSDGSLCIMEALTTSRTQQVMVPSSSSPPPKLEDFLGDATMGAHDGYGGGSNEREAMALSLDSIYYNNQSAETHQNNREHSSSSLNFLSDPFRQQHHVPYYSSLSCNEEGIFQQQYEEQTNNKEQQHVTFSQQEDGIANCFRNFVAPRDYSSSMENNGVNVGVGASSKSLSLSMSPGSQSSCVTVPTAPQISNPSSNKEESSLVVVAMEGGKKRSGPSSSSSVSKIGGQKQTVHRKSIETFGQRTSQYRGVTRHRWTGRYEAHLWDNSCKKEGQTRKGRQVYLGGYDMEEKAARAYDLAALKYWGASTHINFPVENYQTQLEEMKDMSRQEYVAHLRRKSSGFSRGASMYRGVTRHHQHGRWQARIGRVAGNKDLYLGTFSTQEEAAEAYDVAAIKFRGVSAVTNFDITRYDVEKIMASNTLLSGDMARRNNNNNVSTEARTSDHAIVEYNNIVASSHVINKEQQIDQIGNNNEIGSNWKVDLYPQQQSTNSCGNYRNHHNNFNVGPHDLIGVDSLGSSHTVLDETVSKVGTNFSNQASIVTSLSSSSREGTPRGHKKKVGPTTMLFQKQQQQQHPMVVNSGTNGGGVSGGPNWFSMSQNMPLFAAWNDL